MSWDYNFSRNYSAPQPISGYNKTSFDLLGQQLDQRTSVSSSSSESESGVMSSYYNPKLLSTTDLWGEAKKNNTLGEAQFFQNQLLDKAFGTHSTTPATTPAVSTAATPPIPHFNPLTMSSNGKSSINNNNNHNINFNHNNYSNNTGFNTSSVPQMPFHTASTHTPFSMNEQHTIPDPQALLKDYQQQQQQYLELLQQQQQWLQNPLFLQQQAQLVAQQLQQLQGQLQTQQQQIETANSLLLSKKQDPQPLTQENLIKLDHIPQATQDFLPQRKQKPVIRSPEKGGASHTSDDNKVNTELYKTELCSTFRRTGSCPYGAKCQFAHGQHELKHVDRGSKWRSKACANWSKTGTCRYGSRCSFRHGN